MSGNTSGDTELSNYNIQYMEYGIQNRAFIDALMHDRYTENTDAWELLPLFA